MERLLCLAWFLLPLSFHKGLTEEKIMSGRRIFMCGSSA